MKQKLLIILTILLSFQGFSQINLVKDLYEGDDNSGNPTLYGIYKNKLYLGSRTDGSPFREKSFSYDGSTIENIVDSNNNQVSMIINYMPENGADDPMIVAINDGSGVKTFTYNGSNFNKISDEPTFAGGIKFNGKYYLTGSVNNKHPLFYTDGTASGTGYLNDNLKTLISFQVTERAVLNNFLLFVADTPESGEEIWKTDGTDAGTVLLKDIYPGDIDSDPRDFFTTADKSLLYFTAKTENEGRELWVTDGTTSGTKMLKDFNSGTSGDNVTSITEMNGKVYFVTNDKLWVTDGTPENTTEIAESDERYLITLNNELFFHNGKSMYKTDGTVSGTSKVTPDNIGIEWRSYPFVFNNEIYFGGGALDRNGNIDVNELWKTDGTTNGTVLVKVIDTERIVSPGRFVKVGSELVFIGNTNNLGQELWKTDGTTSGTMVIQDKVVGSGGFFADIQSSRTYAILNNRLVLSVDAKDGKGKELYEYYNGVTASILDNSIKDVNVFYTSKKLHIRGLDSKNSQLKIYNILGKIVQESFLTSNNTTVKMNLNSGIYISVIRTEEGKLLSKKFVVAN